MSRLIAVGVGPGDPELITLKGVRLLQEADIVLTPVGDRSDTSVARTIVEAHLDPSRQQVFNQVSPMTADRGRLEDIWAEAAEDVGSWIDQGRTVAFVTLGDPCLYSTFLHLWAALQRGKRQVEVEIVPGVNSFTAAAALADVPLGLFEDRLAVLPSTAAEVQLMQALGEFETVVLMKVNRHFDRILRLLERTGRTSGAVFVKRAGLPGQKVLTDLGMVDEKDLDYLSLIIVGRGANFVEGMLG
ncbi:MAG TPA: precorrin-2 C(20)-methyltransferase [Desulfuromonadales bacterium]|nr:precorrin-2 C(20)-methyltransferase [Desulfuromonadales bacterium]